MGEFIKKYFKHLVLVAVYTILMMTIYIVWFESLWHLWYVDSITGIVILAGGVFIGYKYVKGIVKETEEKEKKENIEEIKIEEPKEDVEAIQQEETKDVVEEVKPETEAKEEELKDGE